MTTAIIVCLAIAYAAALVIEFAGLRHNWSFRRPFSLGCVTAGWLVHTIYLMYRLAVVYQTSPGLSLFGIKQDWYFGAAWGLVLIYLLWSRFDTRRAFAVCLLPLALALLAVGYFLADAQPFARGPASQVLGAVHGISLLVASLSVLVAFSAGVMYLGQSFRLKHKRFGRLPLPSLEWLRRTNIRAIGVAIAALAVGIFSGVVLNVISVEAGEPRLPWYDPVVLATAGMFGWLVLMVGLGTFYRPAREGRKVAYLTLVSFVFLVLALGTVLSRVTQHGGRRDDTAPPASNPQNVSAAKSSTAAVSAMIPSPDHLCRRGDA
ncbi:cytochrome c biogenesis protein CcsA [Thermostilla marina]